MATVAPAVAAEQLLTIVTALYNYNYVNTTKDAAKFMEVVGFVVSSGKEMLTIANSTGLTFQDVNRTLTKVYLCMNHTLGINKNDYLGAWSCVQSTPNSKTVGADYCENLQYNMNALLLGVMCLIGAVFLLVWSFVGRRKSCCLKCCRGFPRAVVPLNMLDSYENRLGYAAAFGVTTLYCIIVLFGSAKSVLGTEWGKVMDVSPGYVSIFFKMLATNVIASAAYPLFTCLSTHHKVIGSIFGLLYSITWFALMCWTETVIITDSACTDKKKTGGILAFQLFGLIPQGLCLGILAVQFSFTLFVAVRKRQGKWLENASKVHYSIKDQYIYAHVKNLLKGIPEDSETPIKETFKMKIKKRMYQWKPEFKYSVRIVCAFTVSTVAVYTLTVQFLFIVWYYCDYLLGSWVESSDFIAYIGPLVQNSIKMINTIRTHFRIAIACFYAAVVLSSLKTFLVFFNMLSLYRRHMIRLRKGDRSWLPSSVRTLSSSPASLVAASMKYAGFQVGYAAWGYAMFVLLLWIVFVVVISLILYPLFHGESSFLLKLVHKLWPAALISFVVNFAQVLAAKFFFLQQRGAIISIDNRRAFHIASYYLFFFNIFLGLFSCLFRIIKGIVIGVLFLERVQKSILPRSFEPKDPGYYAYIGYILTEHSHANPVLSVFFCLLGDSITKTENNILSSTVSTVGVLSNDTVELNNDLEMKNGMLSCKGVDRWKVVRNRWNVAYTLINNPCLVKYRKSQIENNDTEECLEESKPCSKEEEANIKTAVVEV